MILIQARLVNAHATLVLAKIETIEEVPEQKIINSTSYPIRSEVELEIARRTIEALE